VAALHRDPAELTAIRERLGALPPNRAVYEVLGLVGRELGSGMQAS
jgi:hypothetical protein